MAASIDDGLGFVPITEIKSSPVSDDGLGFIPIGNVKSASVDDGLGFVSAKQISLSSPESTPSIPPPRIVPPEEQMARQPVVDQQVAKDYQNAKVVPTQNSGEQVNVPKLDVLQNPTVSAKFDASVQSKAPAEAALEVGAHAAKATSGFLASLGGLTSKVGEALKEDPIAQFAKIGEKTMPQVLQEEKQDTSPRANMVADAVTKMGDKWQAHWNEQLKIIEDAYPTKSIRDNPEQLADPQWWANTLAENAVFMSDLMLAGGATAAGGAGVIGSTMASDEYDKLKAIRPDMSKEDMVIRSSIYGLANAALMELPLGTILESTVPTMTRRAVSSAIAGAVAVAPQEPMAYTIENLDKQGITLSDFGKGLVESMKKSVEQAPGIMLASGLMGAAGPGHAAEPIRLEGAKPTELQGTQPPPLPPEALPMAKPPPLPEEARTVISAPEEPVATPEEAKPAAAPPSEDAAPEVKPVPEPVAAPETRPETASTPESPAARVETPPPAAEQAPEALPPNLEEMYRNAQEPPAASAEPERIVSPAIEVNGTRYTGETHDKARLAAMKAGEDTALVMDAKPQFLTTDDRMVDREEAAKDVAPEVPTKEEPGKLHSGDMKDAGYVTGEAPKKTGPSAAPLPPTGMTKKWVDAKRVEEGLEPIFQPGPVSMESVMKQVELERKKNPLIAKDLVASIVHRPRAINSVEGAHLLVEQRNLYNEKRALLEKEYEVKGNRSSTPEQIAEVEGQLKKNQDALNETQNAIRMGLSATGSGLRFSQELLGEEYTLENMMYDKRAKREGRPLNDEERAYIEKLQKTIEDNEKLYEENLAKSKAANLRAQRKYQVDETTKEVVKEENTRKMTRAPRQKKPEGAPSTLREKMLSVAYRLESEALASMRARLSRVSANPLDPEVLVDVTKLGTSYVLRGSVKFSDWAGKMRATLKAMKMEVSRKYLRDVFDSAKVQAKVEEDKAQPEGVPAEVPAAAPEVDDPIARNDVLIEKAKDLIEDEGTEPKDLRRFFVEIDKNVIRSGLREEKNVTPATHEIVYDILKDKFPEWSEEDTMQLLSSYGESTPLNQEIGAKAHRQYNGSRRAFLKIRDMVLKREPGKQTGKEREPKTDDERHLDAFINEAKKLNLKIDPEDKAKQLQSSMETTKKQLNNEINDIEYEIATGERIVSDRKPNPTDAEIEKLRTHVKQLRVMRDEIFRKPGLTTEQRMNLILKNKQDRINELKRRIKENDLFPTKSEKEMPKSDKLDAANAEIKALEAELKSMQDIVNPPPTDEERWMNAFIARQERTEADYQRRRAEKNFAPKQRKQKYELSPEAKAALLAKEKAKSEFRGDLWKDEMKKRSTMEKALDFVSSTRRGLLLTNPYVLAKLTVAAMIQGATSHATELAGTGWRKVFPKTAESAPRQGGNNLRALMRADSKVFTSIFPEIKRVMKEGQTSYETIHGNARQNVMGEYRVDQNILDYVGRVHAALKVPEMVHEFELSYEVLGEFYAKKGMDVHSPEMIAKIGTESLKNAYEKVFRADNRAVSAFNNFVRTLESPDSKTRKVPVGGKTAATAMRVLFPIVRVPTNIVAKAIDYGIGLETGLGELGWRKAKELTGAKVEDLTPEQADKIMKNLKEGTVGTAMLLLGTFLWQQIGGYHEEGSKKKKDALQTRSAFGISARLLHHPIMEMMQTGATAMRIANEKMRVSDKEPRGYADGAWHSFLGLIEEAPLISEPISMARAFNKNESDQYFGELLKSFTVPQIVDYIAQRTDLPNKEQNAADMILSTLIPSLYNDAIQREPDKRQAMEKKLIDYMKTGIPGLREKVTRKGNSPANFTPTETGDEAYLRLIGKPR